MRLEVGNTSSLAIKLIVLSFGTGAEALRSGVGNHSRYLALLTIRNQNGATQLLLNLLGLGGQNVALLGLTAENFPRTGLLKALGRALMGLQFGHGFPAYLACFYFSDYTGERLEAPVAATMLGRPKHRGRDTLRTGLIADVAGRPDLVRVAWGRRASWA